eukprot:scaffold109_cov252-Pinguiococcus_pyrenoidosus.AAC.107
MSPEKNLFRYSLPLMMRNASTSMMNVLPDDVHRLVGDSRPTELLALKSQCVRVEQQPAPEAHIEVVKAAAGALAVLKGHEGADGIAVAAVVLVEHFAHGAVDMGAKLELSSRGLPQLGRQWSGVAGLEHLELRASSP